MGGFVRVVIPEGAGRRGEHGLIRG
jgi:hypothetical protein